MGADLDRHAVDDAQTVPLQAHDLAGIVRQEADLADAQIHQDLRPDTVVAEVRFEP